MLFCSCLSPGVESASSWGDFWGNPASLVFCFCKMSETFDPQSGGGLLIPRARDHYSPGFLLLPLVGAQVHVYEQTYSPVLFVFAAAPDFAPHGTSLLPQPRRVSRYCNVACASLQLPLATQPVPHCGPGLLPLPHMLMTPLAQSCPLALCGFPGRGVRLPEQTTSMSAGSSIASAEQKFFLSHVVGYRRTASCTATCATAERCLSRALEKPRQGWCLPGCPRPCLVPQGPLWDLAGGGGCCRAFLEMPAGWCEAVALADAPSSGLCETTVEFGNGVQSCLLPCRFQGRSLSLAMDLNPPWF